MQFVHVDGVLAGQVPSLAPPRLTALKTDDTLYTLLALQPEGRISITEGGIGHADALTVTPQLSAFLGLAARLQPDLVVAPEYCVPWEVLSAALEGGVAPAPGKLWVLGCQSLPLGGLDPIRDRLRATAVVIDDESSPVVRTTQRYRNPMAYVFQTQVIGTEEWRLVMLVQYKTEPSGDPDNTEATGMLPGSSVYMFGTAPGEVRLATLICSDVFGLTDEQVRQNYDGLLLLHIQLNNNPRHAVYKPYRQKLFAFLGKTEVICLNWAAGITVRDEAGNVRQDWRNIGGSAWYLHSEEVDISDQRIAENHSHGLYYTRYESVRVHAIQFHYGPQAFLIQSTKVFHHGVLGPRSHLSGPKALSTYRWFEPSRSWEVSPAAPADGFDGLVDRVSAGVDLDDISDVYATGPVAAERLLALTAGEFGPGQNWYSPRYIDSMRLCSEEVVRRMTFTLDPLGDQFRSNRMSAARAIASLRSSGYPWPAEVAFLQNGFRLRWTQMFPNRNVEALDGSRTLGTVVFAGQLGDPRLIELLEQRARLTIAGPVPEPGHVMTDDEWTAHKRKHYVQPLRLCVLFNDGATVRAYRSPTTTSIASPAGTPAVDIASPAARPMANE